MTTKLPPSGPLPFLPHRTHAIVVMSLGMALAAGLAGCAGTPLTDEAAPPSVPSSNSVAAPLERPSDAIATQPEVVTTPVPTPELATPTPTGPPTDLARYGERPDAQQLALDIANRHKLPQAWVMNSLAQARYREVVTRLIMPAANPGAKNWAAYRSRFVEPQRLRAGQRFWQAHADTLQRAEQRFGVPAQVIAGVIGVETLYGRDMGRFRVLDALATLSLDFPSGRSDRSAFFRQELGEFLAMCQEQGLEPTQVLGSFAGAIGWPQFMPSSIRQHAVDFDGDGHIDLVNSPADAIGSVANFLARHGWQAGWPTHYPVRPPASGPSLDELLAPDIRPTFTAQRMQALGAKLSDDAMNHAGPLALVLLHNAGKAPTYVAGTRNFYALTRYNQSSYYALAVIELGEAISATSKRANQ
jgi:membrane-bound lytic murein transglycosylase B